MSNLNYFKEKFTSKSSDELNAIVDNPTNYQEDAVLAAKQLLVEMGEREPETPAPPVDEDNMPPDQLNYKIPIVSRTHRFVHYLVDSLVIFVLTMFMIQVFSIGGYYMTYEFGPLKVNFNNWNRVLISGLYYVLFEFYLHKSLGKFVTKTIVVDEQGQFLSLKKTIIRTLCRLIPFEGFSCLLNPSIGWHDQISKSFVIYESELETFRNRVDPDAVTAHLVFETD